MCFPGWLQCVLASYSVFWLATVCSGWLQCVLASYSVLFWLATVCCSGWLQCVVLAGYSVFWLATVCCSGWVQCAVLAAQCAVLAGYSVFFSLTVEGIHTSIKLQWWKCSTLYKLTMNSSGILHSKSTALHTSQ